MGGGQSTDEKLDNVNKKLETMQHTIDSLPRTAGCDLQAVNRSVNGRLSVMETTISSSRDQLNEVNQRLDTMRDNMITGVDCLNENIINSYYYISQQNNNTLFVERGFAHGCLSLSDDCKLLIRADNYFHPDHGMGIFWGDDDLSIDWALKGTPIISDRDHHYGSFRQFKEEIGAIEI